MKDFRELHILGTAAQQEVKICTSQEKVHRSAVSNRDGSGRFKGYLG